MGASSAAPSRQPGEANGRPRPPGPEERRNTASNGRGDGQQPPGLGEQLRSPRTWIGTLAVWLLLILLEQLILPRPPDRLTISYTFFKQQVAAGNVVEITSRGDDVQGDFKAAVTDPAPPQGVAPHQFLQFATHFPTFANSQALDQLLETHNVTISARPLDEPRSPLLDMLFAFGPAILLIGGFLWLNSRLARNAGGGVMGLGRSRARRYDTATGKPAVTFDDVAGIDAVESELAEVVDFLKQPEKYQRLGGRMPKGVLLVGPPGTGKTLLARAVAGEAGVPFFSISGSEFVEMIVGVGAARVRDLFAEAKKAAPAIVFVDELDAIGRRRGGGSMLGGNEEREQTLNQLLVEMDGFDSRDAVIVLSATNRPDVLDPALLRPGRFDRRVTVLPPDRVGRAEILKVHTRGVPLAPEVDLAEVAARTPGLVGADLRNLVNEAALLAARKEQDAVGAEDFAEAIEKIALGTERRLALSDADRRLVAYHESGHALLGLLLPDADPPRRVTVVPRGQALGVTLSVPDEDRYNYRESHLRARIVGALGGRAAEKVVYGMVTTGAESDLKQVTDLAHAMVTRWGMSPEVGPLALDGSVDGNFLGAGSPAGSGRPLSDETARLIDAETRRIVVECEEEALNLLTRERSRLDALVGALLREESLDEVRIRAVIGLPVATAPVG
ncbi:MAG TPA: ATP-dependent zinc metalloprotease FtsH [Chloroflexota bacterium]|nr:ATP-dependent zinc metalloprotease FtsH [Chloroflexota bacterium]